MAECRLKIIKSIILVLNSFLLLVGCLLIGSAAYILHVNKKTIDVVPPELLISVIVFIIIGVLVVFLAVFGSIPALFENRCGLITFSCLLGLLTISEVCALMYIYIKRDEALNIIDKRIQAAELMYDENPTAAGILDRLHKTFSCCGYKSYKDWYSIRSSHLVPESCCRVPGSKACDQRSPNMTLTDAEFYTQNCISHEQIAIISVMGVCFGLLFIGIVGIIMSCVLGCTMRNGYKEV